MGPSKPPEPNPPPNRIRLHGDQILREIIKLRYERTDAAQFFPDVGRHFPGLADKLSRDTHPVPLSKGINIIALPLDPYTPVTSYTFLTDVTTATEVTAWDGTLQQFGPSAIRVGENIIGDDFTFQLGYGYFTTMDSADVVTFNGDPLMSVEYVSIAAGLDVVSLVGSDDSVTSYSLFDSLYNGREICQLSGETQSYECAFRVGSSVLGAEFLLEEGAGYFVHTFGGGMFPFEEIVEPSLTIITPRHGDTVYSRQPFINIIFGDQQTGVSLESFTCFINGEDKTSNFTVDDLGANWQMNGAEELEEGNNSLEVAIVDSTGNESRETSTFIVITTPPAEDEHFINGYVYHGDTWEPLEGVAVTVDSIPGVIYTDSTGHYVFPTPGLGEYRIDIQKEHFTYAQRYVLIENGHGDEFVDDAFLSSQDSVITRITSEGGVSVNSHGSIFSSFPAGTVDEDIDAVTTQYDEGEDLPTPLPELSVFTYCADFEPSGDLLDTARIDFLNHRGFASGTPIPLGGYDPETMKWEHEGFAVVGGDSTWFEFGLQHFSPHDPNYPVQWQPEPINDSTVPDDPPDDGGSCPLHGSPALGTVSAKFGGAVVEHSLPSVQSMGADQSISLIYSSRTVNPLIVLEAATAGVPDGWLLPQYTGAQINVVGRRFTGIIEASRDTTRQRIRFDAIGADGQYLPSGAYRYNGILSNFNFVQYSTADEFGGPPVDTTNVWTDFPVPFSFLRGGDITIDNEHCSAFGTGWAVERTQRLYLRPDGDGMIREYGTATYTYEQVHSGPIIDLAVVNTGDDDVSILLGDGTGNFGSRQDYPVGDYPCGIVAGDFNGDGESDLAVYSSGDDNISILLGDGSGNFESGQDYPTGGWIMDVVAGDFNVDEALDLAIISGGDENISILLGDGQGGFSNHQDYLVEGTPDEIITADFNGDSLLDLAVTIGDWDGVVSILLGNGTGNFEERQDYSAPYATGIVAGDFNGNSFLDLAVASMAYDEILVYLGDGAGGFGIWPQSYAVDRRPWRIVSGDFNGDWILDLAVTGMYHDLNRLLGDGTGGFGNKRDFHIGGTTRDLIASDFNGDGFPDLAAAIPEYNRVTILMGDSSGDFQVYWFSVGDQPWGIAAGDFNSDNYEPVFRSAPDDPTRLIINPDSSGYTRLYPDSSKVLFDTLGLHIATIDRHGNTINYEYDDQERLIIITYPDDLITTIEYGTDGKIETVTDPANRITNFDHDLDGNLISITEPDGSVTKYEYDVDHLLTKIIGPRNDTTIYVYDTLGYVVEIIGADSSTNNFKASDNYNTINEFIAQGSGTPDNPAPTVEPQDLVNVFVNTLGDTTFSLASPYGRPTEKTDVLGNIWRHEYNADGQLTKTTRPDSTVTMYTWTETGQMTSQTDSSNGATTSYEYDSVFNQLTMEINALNDTTRYDLDSIGNTIRIINALGDTTHQFYDSTGQLTKSINALGDSAVYWRNSLALVDSLMNELGYVTDYEYDLAGNMTAEIDPLGNRTEYEYDVNNRLTLVRDPLGRETEYVYGYSGRSGSRGCCNGTGSGDLLIAIVNPAGDTTWFEYDKMGRRVRTINPLGDTTRTEYDSEGRMIRTIDPEGRWISYAYDVGGNMTSLTDSLGRTTSYVYDSRGRTTHKINALSDTTEFIYDGSGNLTHLVNANGDTTTFTYDLMNRKTSETDPLSRTEYWHYDPIGQVDTSVSARGDTTTYTYDALSRLTLKQFPVDSLVYQYDALGSPLQIDDADSRLVMTYDANGRLSTVTNGNPANPNDLQPQVTISYVYDSAGQKTAMVYDGTDSTRYYYDLNGELDSLVDPDAENFTFTRDKLGRPTRLDRPNGTWTNYEYDRSSLTTKITHWSPTGVIDSLIYFYNGAGMVEILTDESDTTWYIYDSTDQLTGATYTDVAMPMESYEYDPVGNRLSSHLSTSYSYDDANQITEDDQWTYVFDDNGNMIEKTDKLTSDRWEYDYDFENRMMRVRKYDGGVTLSIDASYRYNVQGRRIANLVDTDTTVYVYDSDNFIKELDGNGVLQASYVNGLRIDRPLKVNRDASDYYFHPDRLGSVRHLTDDGPTLAKSYSYGSFGVILEQTPATYFSPYTFSGREWDEESELYYYRVRYVDPFAGRFLTLDLLRMVTGRSRYMYVRNNPVNLLDPSGRDAVSPDSDPQAAPCRTTQCCTRRYGGEKIIACQLGCLLKFMCGDKEGMDKCMFGCDKALRDCASRVNRRATGRL